jgi:hypothetical protein
MKWLIRPAGLIVLSLLLVALAALIVLYPDLGLGGPRAAQVTSGSREIVWLMPATSGVSWERLVQAMKRSAQEQQLQIQETRDAADLLPEVILRGAGEPISFRWYKLTSDWTADYWCRQLLKRDPPPLAIISGSTTNMARQVATALHEHAQALDDDRRPLLLLTTATADSRDTHEESETTPEATLESLYPGRTYRLCFTNRQMARAITRFLWSRPDLKPDRGPVLTAQWIDDGYSRDLFLGYQKELERRKVESEWQLLGAIFRPSPMDAILWCGLPLAPVSSDLPIPLRIETSVGTFNAPNTFEARSVRYLLEELRRPEVAQNMPRRPLLVVTGQIGPTRRFVRELARWDPNLARRFVVASGDAISFDHVYRDRRITWPVQDLPVVLVFFSHRNPIDPRAGFLAEGQPLSSPTTASSTATLRLYEDIIDALVFAAPEAENAEQLRQGLGQVRFLRGRLTLDPAGSPLFGADGRRNSSTGEHVVCVRPMFIEEQAVPEALIEIWRQDPTGRWVQVGDALTVSYHDQERSDDRP